MAGALLEALLDRDALAGASRTSPAWLADARRAAAEALVREGLPGARNEAWKYTSLRALEQRKPIVGDAEAKRRAVEAATFGLPGIDGSRLVFVNGVLRDDLSRVEPAAGLSIFTLATANPAELEPWRAALARDAGTDAAFARLNTALAADGPLVRVAPGATIDAPVHLVFVGIAAEQEIAWHARALIEVGAGASLRVVEHHVGAAAAQIGNVVAQYALGAGAKLDLVGIQGASDAATLIRRSEFSLGAGAVLSTHALDIGAQLARHDIDVALAGRGARFASRGVFALRGRQHADLHLDVRHAARDTASDILWRGVADGRARGVFHGAITVEAGADGADANLSNKNLLLSPHAEIDTQPVLEIYADEVKAAHGATVGQLDEGAMFYLRSRGLPPDAARQLLIAAFCGVALADVAEPALREHLAAMLASRLPRIGED
ncbi:MAG TPA: Fe-S cluster assembly protein SufD [Rhodanobacteraceae bacterium]|nr:Fe-S cluster assembly protein SufD [Rhodanobacteraceae bacterium]